MAYITIDENTLYIQGGIDPSDTNKSSLAAKSKQFFTLDLTRPTAWNTTATTLPWTQLNTDGDSGPAAYGHFLFAAPKRRNISVLDPRGTNSSIMSYNLDANRWTKAGDQPKELTAIPGLQAVAHPTSGLVYIPSGRDNADGDMLIYDPTTSITTWTPMPSRDPNNGLQFYGYSFVWSSYRGSFLIFGGGGDVGSYFHEFKVSYNSWTEVPMKGFQGYIPPRLKNACLIPAYNGTKMILFGGQTFNGATPGSLYTLDMESMTWDLTQTVPTSQSRHSMACSVSGDNFIIWGGQSSAGAIMSGTPLIYNINTSKWTTQFVRGTSFTPTGPLTARNTGLPQPGSGYDATRSSSMTESDVSLTHIVSPPPLPGAGTSGQGNITELNSSRQRLHGSHSNSQPITLAGHQAPGSNSDLSNNYNHNNNSSYNANHTYSSQTIHAHHIDNDPDSQPLPLPPISTIPHTNSSWSTPPQNPSWPTSTQPSCSPLHPQPTSSLPSSSSSWASIIPPSNSPSAPPPPNSPSAPPPPYPASVASDPVAVFREEAMTESIPVPVAPIKKEAIVESTPVHTFNSNIHINHINNDGGISGSNGGYAIHERQVEELQHQLAARKEELVRQNSDLRPQHYPPPPPVVFGGSGGFTSSKAVVRSPQGAGNPVVQGSSGSGSSTTGGTSNEELQQQVQALQAELNRLQALIG
ncbi:MAG: hypothetical protein JOS17DRAFT_778626 [Linnemannia elongata]|nr:MAG: hypothetical protein JOS17DRAFT_778626 [Linnemannia elongata]